MELMRPTYEYKTMSSFMSDDALNQLGAVGWELVAVTTGSLYLRRVIGLHTWGDSTEPEWTDADSARVQENVKRNQTIRELDKLAEDQWDDGEEPGVSGPEILT